MTTKINRALLGAALALALAPAAASAGTTVLVRVEGGKKTLLPATAVSPPSRAVTRSGKSCPANSGLGVFDRAVHGHWSGTYFTGLGWQPQAILGDRTDFTQTKSYFELFVNNVSASVGLCSLTPHRGQQILLAEVPATGVEDPIGIKAPARTRVGRLTDISVVGYDVKGHAKPLTGTSLALTKLSGHGRASAGLTAQDATYGLTLHQPGKYRVTISKRGWIRDEVTLTVTP